MLIRRETVGYDPFDELCGVGQPLRLLHQVAAIAHACEQTVFCKFHILA